MWYKLRLNLKEALSKWTGLHRASGQSVAWVRTEGVGSGLATGKSSCWERGVYVGSGFERALKKVLHGSLVTGLRVLPSPRAPLLRSWPGSHFPQLSSRSFSLPGRWFSWQCTSFSDRGKGSVDTAGSSAHG